MKRRKKLQKLDKKNFKKRFYIYEPNAPYILALEKWPKTFTSIMVVFNSEARTGQTDGQMDGWTCKTRNKNILICTAPYSAEAAANTGGAGGHPGYCEL